MMTYLRSGCHKPVLGLAIIFASFLFITASNDTNYVKDCQFPALFAFGDSLTDTGNAQIIFPWQHAAASYPYGKTYFGQPTNRFSNGRLIIDFIAQALGLPFLNPYLNYIKKDFRSGANFAFSGATASSVEFLVPYKFSHQVDWFKQLRSSAISQSRNGSGWTQPLPDESYFHKALYFVNIGGNDYNSAVMNHNSTLSEVLKMIPGVVDEILQGLRDLYHVGARNFMVFTLPPIGCAAEFLLNAPYLAISSTANKDGFGCSIPYNYLLSLHNLALKLAIAALRLELHASKIIVIDYYEATFNISRDYQQYGFTQTIAACCGGGGGELNFDLTAICSFPNSTVCDDPNQYINWDGIHPTERFYKVATTAILKGHFVDPPNAFDNCSFDFTQFDVVPSH